MRYVIAAKEAELRHGAGLALLLWPQHTLKGLEDELSSAVQNGKNAVLLAYDGDTAVGFAHCSLRFDYVEGTQSSPVGYLEGIYVLEAYRRRGVAAGLLRQCEAWARAKGCAEFASDIGADNLSSYAFHISSGFSEAGRIICFAKKL